MKVKRFYLYLLLLCFAGYGCAGNQLENDHAVSTWSFFKVSEKDLFSESSVDVRQSLNTLYGQVKITLGGSRLTINNQLLEQDLICSTNYIKIKKTPLEYFFSQKTKDLYDALFSEENIPLADHIYIITASKPEQECEDPYSEIIENNGYLVVVDKEYLLFFKNNKYLDNASLLENKDQFRDDFPTYCKDEKKDEPFDGSSKYVCSYPNKTLSDIYSRMKNVMSDSEFMIDKLPLENVTSSKNDATVSYEWINPKTLKLVITKGSEVTTYLFKEKTSNTELVITIDTGY